MHDKFYFILIYIIQPNFNGSNTFGTMQVSSRQGKFEPMRVDYSARSGGFFFDMTVCCVFSLESPHRMSTHSIPFST